MEYPISTIGDGTIHFHGIFIPSVIVLLPYFQNFTTLAYGEHKGRVLSSIDGALYIITRTVINKSGKKIQYMKCNVQGCKCRSKITADALTLSGKIPHNHPIDLAIGKINQVFVQLMEEVRTTTRLVRDLHMEMLRRESLEIAMELPWKKVRDSLNRIRRKVLPACSSLSQMIDLLESNHQVQELYGNYREAPLYRGAITVNCKKSVVFVIDQHLRKLQSGFNMYGDGTFSILPLNCKQLYVIMGEIDGKPRLIAYILMEGRKYEDYFYLFEFLRDALQINPGSLMADFEKAVRKAAREVWPACKVEGCMFHFCQALRRKARSFEEIAALFCSPSSRTRFQANKIIRMYMRLCMLPTCRIEEGLEKIVGYTKQQRHHGPFIRFNEYFKETWMNTFKLDDWNVSNRFRRTNNDLESLNGILKTFVKRHPSVYQFMDSMLSIVHRANINYEYETKHKTQKPTRSKFTEPLKLALEHLELGVIDTFQFLEDMAKIM